MSACRPALQGTSRKAGSHENWGIFKCHKWGELLRHSQMYQGAYLMRGLANVRAEFSLTALAYNLRRALNILGVEAMTPR